MKKSDLFLMFVFLLSIIAIIPNGSYSDFASAQSLTNSEISISAKSALLIDTASGTIVYEKNSNERLPIASMTKLATLAIVFDAIDGGLVKLTDDVVVSKTAAAVGGSSAFLDAGSIYKLSDLIKTVVVASANDSSVAIAEFISGSEQAFVSRMNKLVEELNLENTHFENCTGLPTKNHYSSAQDIVQIYNKICANETYVKFSKIWLDELVHPSGRRTELVNTNRLVKTYDGIEGGKTGYTDAARFCLTASAKRGEMRLIGVVIGVDDSKTRFAEMTKLFDYGFSNFKNEEVINNEVAISVIKPKNAKNMAEVYPEKSIVKFLRKDDNQKFTTDYQIYDISAPIAAGSEVGKIFVFDDNNMVIDEVSLITKQDIEEIDLKYLIENIVKAW